MSNMTRDVTRHGYHHKRHAPPPLHVADSDTGQANWWPYRRPYLAPSHPGPVMVAIPHLPADEYGEDPTDPARCHQARTPTAGLVARLDVRAARTPNVTAGGVRK